MSEEAKIGTHLGPFEITGKLGEGGMGEVWRASDSKLRRDVALKLLPEAFTEDTDRLARFEREAQLLAQLQHPNIASIYGLEDSGELRALVIELVEGPTLAERLEAGALSVEEALTLARQVAEALEEAHDKGIVHRDLKPQNVKVTADGKIKVLDFGLAKAMDPGASSTGQPLASPTLLDSPTLTAAATQLGVILGTAAYMAPEQARGQAVDKRADIWAFGVLLYEMLVGESMFAAETVSDTLAGVLRAGIDLEQLPQTTPPAIRRLLRRALERNPKNRLHDIADARIVLDEVLSGRFDEPVSTEAPAIAAAWRRGLPWVLAAVSLTVALVALFAGRTTVGSRSPLRADLGAPEEESFHFQGDYGAPAVLSPDGSRVAFGTVGDDGKTHLWVRSLDDGEERRLEGTEGAFAPFFSPDGGSLGFFADAQLRTVSVRGGPSLLIAVAPNGRGGVWLPDGTIVFSPDFRAGLFRVPATGGSPEPVTVLDSERHSSHRWPAACDDGQALVYLATTHVWARQDESELRWMRLDQSGDRALLRSPANGQVSDGQLLFVRASTLFAQTFDAAAGTLHGEASVVAQDLLYDPSTWRATFSAAAGRLVYSPAGAATGSHITRVDRAGRVIEELIPDGVYFEVSLSPDGRRMIVSRDAPTDLWLFDLDRGTFGRFTFGEGDEASPAWSRDGLWVYYVALGGEEGPDRILRKAPDGGGGAEPVYESKTDRNLSVLDVAPDGRSLLVVVGEYPFVSGADLFLLELDGERRLLPLVAGAAVSDMGRFSADGRWLLYTSYESGTSQVYVRSADPGDVGAARWQVSVDGGLVPQWSADGSEIVYLEPSLNLSRVSVTDDGAGGLRFGAPEALFGTTLLADQQSFALSPDGQSLILNHYGEAQSRPLRLIDGWRSLLPDRKDRGQ